MKNSEAELARIAQNSLDCIDFVAKDAENARRNHKPTGASAFASINTFNSPSSVNSLGRVADAELEALSYLIKQPVIARIDYIDEDDNEDTIFITRNTPRTVPGFKLASYRAPLGRIASLRAGDESTFKIGNTDRDLFIHSSTRLRPFKENGEWDSKDSEIDVLNAGRFTVRSLRELLEPQAALDDDDIESLWDDEGPTNVVEGVRRAILTHMGLRDQPILDLHQDEIFRMPINTRCFLSGPPGTGKTTTLIRRLGQKSDIQALEASGENLRLIRQVAEETGRPHESSWILFSPTELLRQYVKEAFNKEGLAASDANIRTWDEFRRDLAREQLGLLRTSSGSGPFIERREQNYLSKDTLDTAKWYDEFRQFLDNSVRMELKENAQALLGSDAEDLILLGFILSAVLEPDSENFYGDVIRGISDQIPDIRNAIAVRGEEIGKILTRARNVATYADRNFPDLLRAEISRQLSIASQELDVEDELESVVDDDEDQQTDPQPGRPVSKTQALSRFEKALKYLAKSRRERRRILEKSQDGMLLSWLGEDRIPTNEVITRLGKLMWEQSILKKFERLDRLFIRGIPPQYKRFRAEAFEAGLWYDALPSKSSDILWQELDLIILSTLQISNQVLASYRSLPGADLPASGPVSAIRYLQRSQVLVDEATDFSRVQLACMNELAHPLLGSFFLCGDINQRLTSWGLNSSHGLDWISENFERKSITVSYRQSQLLVNLAKDIAVIGGAQTNDTILPDRLDSQGLPPVWRQELTGSTLVAAWLAKRIQEIDRMVQKSTTIAILVNDEEQVEPLATALNDELEEINLSAVACKDGKVVGNDRDVRVFNIQHIKGLEFEAVFFVSLDQTVLRHPDLFAKYLYVGATRAATYLGITFDGVVPEPLKPLEHHFTSNWSI